jgi:hypothetical protein
MNATTYKRTTPLRVLEAQVRRAQAMLRELKETLEDLEDGLLIEKAKRRNGKKPLLDWDDVAKELGIPKPKRK